MLINIIIALWYIRNEALYKKKGIAKSHEERPHEHSNVEMLPLLDNNNLVRRLSETEPFQLA